ncbi:MAG: magnesium/cobalt efflux protein [Verrucomicrobiaceae bacterium]|nr:magnesium/cobalt efflux protein [Verrucomicrobiaceae bacterium]
MNEAPLGLLFLLLIALVFLSAFFSSSETGMMALNRYRLKHLASSGHKGAKRSSKLLERPERLISVVLIGNTLANVLASALATFISIRILGDNGIAVTIASFSIAVFLLIFAEIAPKTVAALYPERIAFPFSRALKPLLRSIYPLVWLLNTIVNKLLKLFGIDPDTHREEPLSQEELRTIVNEAGEIIPQRHQGMLLNILDLEQMSIDDIMVPRSEVVGLDIDDDDATLLKQLSECEYTRIPIFKKDINNIIGILHLRTVIRLLGNNGELNRRALMKEIDEPYFVPEGTPLHTQLFNFQKQKRRMAIVVDEYGVVQGLIALEDILEEIVGEFTSNLTDESEEIIEQNDGSFLIDGSASVREINRTLDWKLATDGPKTLSGLVLENLEGFPDADVGIRIGEYCFETMNMHGNIVKNLRAFHDKDYIPV